jgi:membrane-bound lytic murein transglycosylase A
MRFAFAATLLLGLSACVQSEQNNLDTPGGLALAAIPLSALPGWSTDNTAEALTAFVRSCAVIAVMPADQSLGGVGLSQQTAGQAGLWQNTCNGARAVPPGDDAAAKAFFSAYFVAYQLTENATITGYFEPEYKGSKNAAPGYGVPLYAKPADPALADLPRAAIDNGALIRKTPVTAYLADPVDAFMLQIQGSGRVLLPNGKILRVGFDGQNGQAYVPIGRILVANGSLAANNVSYQTISAWLKANPTQAMAVMEQNPRYVYLKPLGGLPDELGAPGALGVPLTAGRSLAVDNADIPLGTPVFLSTTNPLTATPLNLLTIAQDTGGGIHGTQAADLFFGAGPDAEAIAGRMQQAGTLFLLLLRPAPSS